MRLVIIAILGLIVTSACATGHTVTRLSDGAVVHTFRREYSNAHVVVSGKNMFMVDAGEAASASSLAGDLQAAGIDPRRLRAIILTHGHADHAGGALYFRRAYGTPIVASRAEQAMLASGQNDHLCPTDGQAERRVADDQAARFSPFQADIVIDKEASLASITGISGRIVVLPGHTAGSLVILLPDATLVGDLFRGAIIGQTAERHFYMCDIADNTKNIQMLLHSLALNATTFFTGHFGPVERSEVAARFGVK